MSVLKFSQFSDPSLFHSIDPPRLRVFLDGYRDYLRSRDFKTPADAKFTDAHVGQLIGILNTATRDTPPDFLEGFFHANELNNDKGMESLLSTASKKGVAIPDGDLTPADLALFLWMVQPGLVRRANCERIIHRFQSFQYYQNELGDAPPFSLPSDAVLKQIRVALDTFNRDRHRGGGSDVWMYHFGDDVAFLLRHGRLIVRDEVMEGDTPRPDVRRSVGYDLVVYNRKTGEIRVRAELVGERRFYCQLFGRYLFDDPGFFPPGELFDLSPIQELGEDIQTPAHVDGIARIRLVEIREVLLGDHTLTTTHRADEVFPALKEHSKQITPTARLLHARFRFWLTDGHETTVTIYSGNIIRHTRPVGVDAIHQWMIHHGIRVRNHAPNATATLATLASHLSSPKSASATPVVARRVS